MKINIREIVKNCIPQRILLRKLYPCRTKSLLLTFDDGPHAEITPEVLNRLKAYKARALFFVVGKRIEAASSVIKQIFDSGHQIGNHTFIHSNDRQPTFLNYFKDLSKCQSLVKEQIGIKPKLFRPPGGRISLESLIAPRILGLKVVHWSLGVRDWNCKTFSQAKNAAEELLIKVTPGDIILLHDDNPFLLDILDIILPALSSRGYDFNSGIEHL